MSYYLLTGVSAALAGLALILLVKKPFFNLSTATLRLLDMMLNTSIDENLKTKELSKRLIRLLVWLFIFLLAIALTLWCAAVFLLPFFDFSIDNLADQDFTSFLFLLSISVGVSIPLLIWPKSKEAYSDWSRLFHSLILDHTHVGMVLFQLDRLLFLPKEKTNEKFLIVSGLARSGTTAFTRSMFASGRFSSLSYANMPMLLAPKLWSKIYTPKIIGGTQRPHGDQVYNDINSVEAFEEYFFNVFSDEDYIKADDLVPHSLSQNTYDKYLDYQKLITRSSNIYLAKNNNLILRYGALRQLNKYFVAVFMFREPLSHARSLCNQHLNFSKIQSEDKFVLQYMNWLGHHEFGLGHKRFQLAPNPNQKSADKSKLNYWLQSWIDYYTYLLQYVHDDGLILIQYEDFLEKPNEVLNDLYTHMQLSVQSDGQSKFVKNTNDQELSYDQHLADKADTIYQQLMQHKKG